MSKESYIKKTFELAKKAQGSTWPNPMVGAVIVKNDRIIGEGYHQKSGTDHAEIVALKNCTESPRGATLYVNLEPCCHLNKQTPPCAQRLIQEGIQRVVLSNLDPNKNVNGKGVQLLKDHGIEVETGVLETEGEKLNEVFFLSQRLLRPFVHLKLASTLDGKMAMPNGESQWITGEMARAKVHELRAQHQGIIVGAKTARNDNPKLNVRISQYQGEQPWRIIFTRNGELNSDLQLLSDELKFKTLIYSHVPIKNFPKEQTVLINSLQEALADLYSRKLISLMLEGGAELAAEFFKQRLIDRVSLFMNPSFLGNGLNMLPDLGVTELSKRIQLLDIESNWIGNDILISGRLRN
jgi:diaminohydroxyphosphoribosylaminopyrimidine deaminase/5-amino-6-(5-phosphoribosylamino)uracil reductase